MTIYHLNQWIEIDDYLVQIEEVKEEIIQTRSSSSSEKVRTVRLLVAYQNQTEGTLKHVGLQWLLYDADGYTYDNEIVLAYFGDDAPRKLKEGRINPGRKVRGWVAFKVPHDAVLVYAQFRANFMTPNTADIDLSTKKMNSGTAVSPQSPANFLQKAWQAVAPTKTKSTEFELEADKQYIVKKPIVDFYGNTFTPGTVLTYEKSYPPYHGLHTLLFAETTLYLHEEGHADIFADWARFIALGAEYE